MQLFGVHLLIFFELGAEKGELHFKVLRGDRLRNAALHAHILSLQVSKSISSFFEFYRSVFLENIQLGHELLDD